MNKETLGYSVKYIESFEYLMEKKCQVAETHQWNLEDIRILLAQSVCKLISIATEKIMNKEEEISDKDFISQNVGINLRDLGMFHAAYYTFDSFKKAISK